MLFGPPGERGGSLRPPGAATQPKPKRGHNGVTSMTPGAVPRAPQRPIPTADCCLCFYSFFYPGEEGGQLWAAQRWRPNEIPAGAVRGHFYGPPQVSAAPTRCRPLVDCYVAYVFLAFSMAPKCWATV